MIRAAALITALLVVAAPAGSNRIRADSSAPYTFRSEAGAWWICDPAGTPFFSSGVCCVGPGQSWEEYNAANPAYAAWREHKTVADWADATLNRLKSWKFTTIGGWSDYSALKRSAKMTMPYTMVLHLGASAGAPWWDMYSSKVLADMDAAARSQIAPVKNDPLLLGYYTDNELGWWNAPLFEMCFDLPAGSRQRALVVDTLEAFYSGRWDRLKLDFTPKGAASFYGLAHGGRLYLNPGSHGIPAVKRCVEKIAERYYALVRQTIRKYDARRPILGDRYQSFYYPEVARAGSAYVDAASTNLNAAWLDGSYPRFFLNTLHELTDRPIMVGEFYMASAQNRSGNKNSSSGFPVAPTQSLRAKGFAGTLTSLAATSYVVGADWFQYADEPTNGRGDGENYNMGLVDIDDRPYEEMARASQAIDRNRIHAAGAPARADASLGVPPAPADPFANWKHQSAMLNWDRERGFVRATTPDPLADMYICWSPEAVYLGVYAWDVLEQGLYERKSISEADRALWTLEVPGAPQILARVGAGRGPFVKGQSVEVHDSTDAENGVYHAVAMKLPAALFGKQRFTAGDTVVFRSRYATASHAYSMEWSASLRLAK